MYSNHFERLPQTLQPKVVAHATTTAKKAENICKRNSIAKDTAAAIVADVCDMLAGEFHGMHATYEQMREVATKTKRSSWARTEINALCMVTEYYARIVENTEQGGTLAHTIIDTPIAYELTRQAGQQPTEDVVQRCMFVYFTLSVLCVGECCDATEEELRGIGGEDAILYEPQRSHTIATALDMQRQRKALEAKQQERERTPREARTELSSSTIGDVAGAVAVAEYIQHERPKYPVSNPDRATKYYQNVSNLLSEELQVAPYSKEGGAQPLRPLRAAIAERIATAEALKEQAKTDNRITAAMVQRAENLITNADSIYKAIDGIHIVVREMQPTSRTDTTTGYTMTAHRFTQLATGQQNPNQQQVINIMRALDFLSMERMDVVEEVVKKYKTKDKDGNPSWGFKKKQFCTRFTPANTRFVGEFGEDVTAANAFTITMQIDRIITDGCSVERKEMLLDNGKKERLKVSPPRENYVTIGQVYAFNSEAGNRFRNILVSKVRMRQDTLLADVFDYKAKEREAQAKLKDTPEWKEWERVKDDTNATDEQKDEAKKKVEPLVKNATAKRIASKHKDRDVATLRKMFEDAQACGMIRSYWTKAAADARQKENGEYTAVVWEWLRPTKDDLKN